jgi:hypothetical protein
MTSQKTHDNPVVIWYLQAPRSPRMPFSSKSFPHLYLILSVRSLLATEALSIWRTKPCLSPSVGTLQNKMYARSLPKHYSSTDIGLKLRYPAETGSKSSVGGRECLSIHN